MSMRVNVHETKTHLSCLLERVMQGEEVVKSGRPVARPVAIKELRRRREPGSAGEQVEVAEDFDGSLPKDTQSYFE
jgi:prevent-host-death family protein